jgi:hypothetical protein
MISVWRPWCPRQSHVFSIWPSVVVPSNLLPNSRYTPPSLRNKSGPLLRTFPVPSRSWPTFPISLTSSGREYDSHVASEALFTLLPASTPLDALPSNSPAYSTPSSIHPDAPSPRSLIRHPRPEDIAQVPMLGRVGKWRRPPPRIPRPCRPK